jgi:hypothetical protein
MHTLTRLIVLVLFSQGVLAKAPQGTNKDCSFLLLTQASPLEYELSDAEGVYLELIQKVQSIYEIRTERMESYIKDILALKAQVLNAFIYLIPRVNMQFESGPEKARVLSSIFQMITYLGVSPKSYGLEMDEQFAVTAPIIPISLKKKSKTYTRDAPIGFVASPQASDRDLPDELKRSIGFGEHQISSIHLPLRMIGRIQLDISTANKEILLVSDPETKNVYKAHLRVLTSMGGKTEHLTYTLDFKPAIGEWIVKVDNLNNPEGHIGFL